MIEVTFTESGEKLSLRLKGHAGYAEIGKDIVCASATILAYTVAQFVTEAEHKGDLLSPPEVKLESGDTIISCEPNDEAFYAIRNAYLYTVLGYQILEHNYPQYVRLNAPT